MSRKGKGVAYICDECGMEYFEREGIGSIVGYAKDEGYTVAYRDRKLKILFQLQELWFCSIGCLAKWAEKRNGDGKNPGPMGTTNDADDWRKVKVSND